MYRVFGISDDYVVINDGNIERRYPFDWESHGSIVVTFEDSAVHLEFSWQYVDVTYLHSEKPRYLWSVTCTSLRAVPKRLASLSDGPHGSPMVEVECDVPPRIVTSPLGKVWTFPEGEER
jgi:hypothetical protein